MGYDIELRFDTNERYDKNNLIRRLCEAGAKLVNDPHYDEPVVWVPGITTLWVTDSEKMIQEGRYIFLRSPSTTTVMKKLIAFAERAGCKVYNPSSTVKDYVTYETINKTLEDKKREMRVISKLFGTVKKRRSKNI